MHNGTTPDPTRTDLDAYWAPDGTPCTLEQWSHHFDRREIHRDDVGLLTIFTIYHGLNGGAVLTPGSKPTVWITIDARRRLRYSATRGEALIRHGIAIADAHMDVAGYPD